MAIKAGRVGVRKDQVDVYGRLVPTDFLIAELRELLDVESAELHALNMARIERLKDKIGIDIPITPITEPKADESFNIETDEEDTDGTESE